MTISLFISILAAGSILSILLTEAIKNWYRNDGKQAPPNLIALINAIITGGGITAVCYMLMAIPWTINNIICLLVLIFLSWLGSMTSYDKVVQTIGQVSQTIGVGAKNAGDENNNPSVS